MAIVNITEPSNLLAGQNPIVISLSTGTVGAPETSKFRFRVTNVPTNNHEIRFSLVQPTQYTKSFWANEQPFQDNFFFTSTIKDSAGNVVQSGITTAMVANSLAEAIQKDLVLSRYYYINYSGGSNVYLIGKEPSSRLKLSASNVYSSNGSNITYDTLQDGADEFQGSTIQDYSLFVETFIDDSNAEYGEVLNMSNFNRLTEQVLPFSKDNIHRFDVHQVCNSYLSTPKPDLNQLGGTVSNSYIKPFAFRFGEKYRFVANENSVHKTNKGLTTFKWVMNAAIDNETANNLTSITGSPVTLLTNSPEVLISNREQKQFIYFLVPKNIGNQLKLVGDITFWDGSKLFNQNLLTIVTGMTNQGGLYCLNVSFNDTGLNDIENLAGKKIKTVDLVVKGEGVVVEELENSSFDEFVPPPGFLQFPWENAGTGSSFVYSAYSGGSAIARLGTTTVVTQYAIYNFNSSYDGWCNTASLTTCTTPTAGSTAGWVTGSTFLKATTVSTFGVKSLRLNPISMPSQPFDVRLKWQLPASPASSNLKMSFIVRAGSSQLFNQQFTNFSPTGSEETATLHITNPAIWTSGDTFIIAVSSTNFVAGDQIFLNSIELLTTANTTSYKTTYLMQDELTSLQDSDHTFTWVWATTGTTNNNIRMVAEMLDNSYGVLSSISTKAKSGSTTIPETIIDDMYAVRVHLENTGTTTNTAVFFKKVSLTSDPTSAPYTKRKKYSYPYVNPSHRFGVIFQNDWGTFDSFDFIGLREETIDRTKKDIEYPVTPNADGSYSVGFIKNAVYDVQVTKRVIVNSGFVSQATFDWLIELMKSTKIYSYTSDFENFLVLDSYKYTKNNQSNEYNIECTFIQTSYENSVTV